MNPFPTIYQPAVNKRLTLYKTFPKAKRPQGATLRIALRVAYTQKGGKYMQTRVAVMSIIVENPDSVEDLNALLHTFSKFVIGRMGIPYREKSISIISVAVDAPQNEISALSGKIGKLQGVSIKTAYSGVISSEQ